jgi:primosomal protein N' (replication factor Y)
VLLAKVAVPVPLGQAFSYLVPPELAAGLRPGARVLCDFGRRRVLGIVLELGERLPEVDPEKLKPIRAIVDTAPVLEDELLGFLRELARYYLAPIGEVMRLAVPAVERSAAETLAQQGLLDKVELRAVGRLVQVAHAVDAAGAPELRGPAAELYARLKDEGPSPIAELTKHWRGARASLRRLERAGLVRIERESISVDPMLLADVSRDAPPELNAAQQHAVGAIVGRLERRERHGFLLHGVTASGKTEVYLRAVARCLELGLGAIVLVPEIALTPQLVARFRARLGDEIAVLHSGLGDRERHAMWKRLRAG